MSEQPQLLFRDDESISTRSALDVVHARVERVETFSAGYFSGFAKFRALTYTPSIPMVLRLLRSDDYDDFECVFGHPGILSRDAQEILAFQAAVKNKVDESILIHVKSDIERQELIYDRVVEGSVRFRVVKDAIAHAKIYLLSDPISDRARDVPLPTTRVIVGSANLSETAFSGRQAETLIVFDDDEAAWDHYSSAYNAISNIASSDLTISSSPIPLEHVRMEDTPALREAKIAENGVTLYVPNESEQEEEFSLLTVMNRVAKIRPEFDRCFAGAARRDKTGNLRITPKVVKEVVRVSNALKSDDTPITDLSRLGNEFKIGEQLLDLNPERSVIQQDVAAWLDFFGSYERGFVGDVARLQRDYFTFMSWFYFTPLMCDLRNAAVRQNTFSFDQPLFAILFGSSNCGKTSLVEAAMASMFSHPRLVNTEFFTAAKLRGLRDAYKRYPVVFDDITRARFNRNAEEFIKDETVPVHEYPCFALSMNADARNFKPEIVKRCLMIYTRTSLPGDQIKVRRQLQRTVGSFRNRITTSLYREYLRRAMEELDAKITLATNEQVELPDALSLSSKILCEIFQENVREKLALPAWCRETNLSDFQERAYERERLLLNTLLGPDRYSSKRRPPEQCWGLSRERIHVGVAPFETTRTRADIPDWLIEDTTSTSGQITLLRKPTERFLKRNVRKPRPWHRF